ncbi:hypothetical protein Tcan_00571, partial [Toxocara canis]
FPATASSRSHTLPRNYVVPAATLVFNSSPSSHTPTPTGIATRTLQVSVVVSSIQRTLSHLPVRWWSRCPTRLVVELILHLLHTNDDTRRTLNCRSYLCADYCKLSHFTHKIRPLKGWTHICVMTWTWLVPVVISCKDTLSDEMSCAVYCADDFIKYSSITSGFLKNTIEGNDLQTLMDDKS